MRTEFIWRNTRDPEREGWEGERRKCLFGRKGGRKSRSLKIVEGVKEVSVNLVVCKNLSRDTYLGKYGVEI